MSTTAVALSPMVAQFLQTFDMEHRTTMRVLQAIPGDKLSFNYEVERGGQTFTVKYSGKIEGDTLRGEVEFGGSNARPWEAKRETKDEGWISLIKGESPAASGWKLRREADKDHKDGWSLKEGVLANKAPSIDLVHEKDFKDFEVHVEFRYPKGQNSGVYLRGCYEVQVEDTHNQPIRNTMCGAVYGKKAPLENAALPAGEWQTFDITLVGNKITVVHNKKKIIDGFEIDGKTGGSLDKHKHGDPGPIMLQGDHGDVEYRNIKVRPITAK